MNSLADGDDRVDSFEALLHEEEAKGRANHKVEQQVQPVAAPLKPMFRSPYELDQDAPPKWLVQRLLAEGELALLFGPWGSFKTFVAVHLATAVADGTPFLGMPTVQGLVLMVCGEGGGGIRKRLRAATSVARMKDKDDPLHRQLKVCTEIPPLTHAKGWDATVREIDAMKPMPALLIIDTWSRLLSASQLDENSQEDAGRMVDALDRLRARYPGLTSLVVHHPPNDHSDRARGSSVLPAATDLILSSEPISTKGSYECKLSVKKLKDDEAPPPKIITLARAIVGEDEAGEVSSLYIQGCRPETGGTSSGGAVAGAAADLLAVQKMLRDRGRLPAKELFAVIDSIESPARRHELLQRWALQGKLRRFPGRPGRPDHYEVGDA
jgi:hypothetical protein